MTQQPMCFFTILRYVADPLRDEACNFGAIAICPELKSGGTRFDVNLTGVKRTQSPELYAFLNSCVNRYATEDFSFWTRETLETKHIENVGIIQFTRPEGMYGDITQVLGQAYQQRVQRIPKNSNQRIRPIRFGPVQVSEVFKQAFTKANIPENWIKTPGTVKVDDVSYTFDLTIRNGHVQYAIKTATFQSNQAQDSYLIGAGFTKTWPLIRAKTSVQGLLVVEPPDTRGTPLKLFQQVEEWAQDSGIEVAQSSELESVAQRIAETLS